MSSAASGRTITESVEQALRAEVTGHRKRGTGFTLRGNPVPGRALPSVDLAGREPLYETVEDRG